MKAPESHVERTETGFETSNLFFSHSWVRITAAETAKNPNKGEAESIEAKNATAKNSRNQGKTAAAPAAIKKTASHGRKNRPKTKINPERILKII